MIIKIIIKKRKKKDLPDGELNPGLPRDAQLVSLSEREFDDLLDRRGY